MPKVLVTGGAGFIGSHIVDLMLKENHEVTVLDNFFTGKAENLHHAENDVEVIQEDIRNLEGVMKACKGIDYILHQAALRSVPASVKDPQSFIDVNITGTYNVLESARQNNVKRVVLASSSSVYGNTKKLPLKEGEENARISPYAISKFTNEDFCKYFTNIHGLETVCLRYFNVFGPRQDPKSPYAAVIPLFIEAVLKNESPIIFGGGEQTRDFTYVENVAIANLMAMTAEKANGQAINIANQESISINTLLAKINKLLGKNIPAKYAPPRQGDVKHTLADNSKAMKLLEYKNFVSFDAGLRITVEWLKK